MPISRHLISYLQGFAARNPDLLRIRPRYADALHGALSDWERRVDVPTSTLYALRDEARALLALPPAFPIGYPQAWQAAKWPWRSRSLRRVDDDIPPSANPGIWLVRSEREEFLKMAEKVKGKGAVSLFDRWAQEGEERLAKRLAHWRERHGAEKWIRLGELAAFFNQVRMDRDQKVRSAYGRMFRTFGFNDLMIQKTRIEHDVRPIDMSDDIYRHSADRDRGVVEVIHNAADEALATDRRVEVKVGDGWYEVRDRGDGMTPLVIAEEFIPPRASGKRAPSSRKRGRGRFGLGWDTALSLLRDPEARAQVTTRARGSDECFRLEYRGASTAHEDGTRDVYFRSGEGNRRLVGDHGTLVRVESPRITREGYVAKIKRHLRFLDGVSLYVNGDLANDTAGYDRMQEDGYRLLYREEGERRLTITMGGSLVEEFDLSGSSAVYGEFVLDLAPSHASLPESWDRIDLDATTKALLADVISQSQEADDPGRYLNSMAALIQALAPRDLTGKKCRDLIDLLKAEAVAVWKGRPRAPNSSLFDTVEFPPGVARVDDLFLSSDWEASLFREVPGWEYRRRPVRSARVANGPGYLVDADRRLVLVDDQILMKEGSEHFLDLLPRVNRDLAGMSRVESRQAVSDLPPGPAPQTVVVPQVVEGRWVAASSYWDQVKVGAEAAANAHPFLRGRNQQFRLRRQSPEALRSIARMPTLEIEIPHLGPLFAFPGFGGEKAPMGEAEAAAWTDRWRRYLEKGEAPGATMIEEFGVDDRLVISRAMPTEDGSSKTLPAYILQLSHFCLPPPPFNPFTDPATGLGGVQEATGKVVIAPEYLSVEYFASLFIVQNSHGRCGVLSPDGSVIRPPDALSVQPLWVLGEPYLLVLEYPKGSADFSSGIPAYLPAELIDHRGAIILPRQRFSPLIGLGDLFIQPEANRIRLPHGEIDLAPYLLKGRNYTEILPLGSGEDQVYGICISGEAGLFFESGVFDSRGEWILPMAASQIYVTGKGRGRVYQRFWPPESGMAPDLYDYLGAPIEGRFERTSVLSNGTDPAFAVPEPNRSMRGASTSRYRVCRVDGSDLLPPGWLVKGGRHWEGFLLCSADGSKEALFSHRGERIVAIDRRRGETLLYDDHQSGDYIVERSDGWLVSPMIFDYFEWPHVRERIEALLSEPIELRDFRRLLPYAHFASENFSWIRSLVIEDPPPEILAGVPPADEITAETMREWEAKGLVTRSQRDDLLRLLGQWRQSQGGLTKALLSKLVTLATRLPELLDRLGHELDEGRRRGIYLLREGVGRFPAETRGYLYYLMEEDAKLLPEGDRGLPVLEGEGFLLSDLIVAYQQNVARWQGFTGDAETLRREVSQQGRGKDKGAAFEALTGAMYHAAARGPASIGQLLQNAIDAVRNEVNRRIEIESLRLRGSRRHLLRVSDPGHGIDLAGALCRLFNPGETDKTQGMLGGFGYGFFSVYPEVEVARVKTGVGDGRVHLFELTPVRSGGKVVDVLVRYRPEPGPFRGLVFEGEMAEPVAEISGAMAWSFAEYFGGAVGLDRAEIFFNGKGLNGGLEMVGSADDGPLGPVRVYRGSESVVTYGGLPKRSLEPFLAETVPPEVMRYIRKEGGLVVELDPAHVDLIRTGTQFEDGSEVMAKLRPALFRLALIFFVHGFRTGRIDFNNLPDEYFSKHYGFTTRHGGDAALLRDAAVLNGGGVIKEVDRYQDNPRDLVKLCARIRFLSIRRKGVEDWEAVSLAELFDLVDAQVPFDASRIPDVVQRRIMRRVRHDQVRKERRDVLEQLGEGARNLWDGRERFLGGWGRYASLTTYLGNWLLGRDAVTIGYSSELDKGHLATHWREGRRHRIYWDVLEAERKALALGTSEGDLDPDLLVQAVDNVSHELTHHAAEDREYTHDLLFYRRQMELVTSAFRRKALEREQVAAAVFGLTPGPLPTPDSVKFIRFLSRQT